MPTAVEDQEVAVLRVVQQENSMNVLRVVSASPPTAVRAFDLREVANARVCELDAVC